MSNIKFENISGKYFSLKVRKQTYRIYMEESGKGTPLLCLHTAGSDSRQFRHVLNDRQITKQFKVIAFDLPWHGKSNPPDDHKNIEYKLTTNDYIELVTSFCKSMNLKKPIIMGCSMGGRIVLHLALKFPDLFKTVIALEGADKLDPYYDLEWLNRPDVHGGEIQAAYVSSQIAPQSETKYRDEILWHYKQGGPGVFKGDLYFYWQDGNFEKKSHLINTKKCPVYLLSGEYDCSCTPEKTMETARRIKGSKYKIIPGVGHFPMSENPKLFFKYLKPILKEIIS